MSPRVTLLRDEIVSILRHVKAGCAVDQRTRACSSGMCAIADEAQPGSIELDSADFVGGLAGLVAELRRSQAAFLRRHEVQLRSDNAIYSILRDLFLLNGTVLPHVDACVVWHREKPSEETFEIFRQMHRHLPSFRVALTIFTMYTGSEHLVQPEILCCLDCPFLHTLDLEAVKVDHEFVAELVARLRPLQVRRLLMGLSGACDCDAEVLATLGSLRELDLRFCWIGNAGAVALSAMDWLKHLNLHDNQISAPGLQALAPMIAAGICRV